MSGHEATTSDPAGDTTGAARRVALGSFMALGSAASFGLITVLARLSYDGGGTPAMVNLFRLSFAVLAAGALLALLRISLRVPRSALLNIIGVSVSLFAASVCYFYAVVFIPVSLFVLIFYIYPFMVAGYTSIAGRTPLGPLRWMALAVAFGGLAVALSPSAETLDWRGIALSLGAAVFVTSLFAFSTRALRHVDVIPLTFWSNLGGVLLAAAVLPFLGGFTLPTSQVGWTGTLGASACYMFAVLCEFSAIRWAGPARTALYFNLEPIVTMAAAALLLGESLLPLQYVGALLVIAALALAARADWARPLSRHGEHGP